MSKHYDGLTKAEKQLTVARTRLFLTMPFFGHLALQLKMRKDNNLQASTATDGKSLIYNPALVESMSIQDLTTGWAHEALHAAFFHPQRRGRRHHIKWNLAGDFVINILLKKGGLPLMDTDAFNENFESLNTDEVYNKLPDLPSQGGGKGHKLIAGCKACGGLLDPASGEQIQQGTAAAEQATMMTKAMLKQAAEVAKSCGSLPGDLELLINEFVDPKIDWRTALRHMIEVTARNDYNWMKPSRSWLAHGHFLPGLLSNELGEIVIAVDTSGSVSDNTLKQFASEISSIMTVVRPTKIHIVYVDTQVAHTDEFSPDELPLKFEAHGRGGTDFVPPFNWVDEQGILPTVFIYLTDGECYSFPPAPGYPTIWAVEGRIPEVPFGQVLELN